MKKNKFKWLGMVLIIMFFAMGNLFVRAEDDDEEDGYEYEDREYKEESKDDSTESNRSVSQTTTTSKSVETIILKDSDGDGILDKDDAHPNVAEIYIVKDDNKNGIVDDFEK